MNAEPVHSADLRRYCCRVSDLIRFGWRMPA